jgi:hypothetical protein
MNKSFLLFLFLFSCSTRVTLNYNYVDIKSNSGDWGNYAATIFYHTLSGFFVRVIISPDSSRVIIRSGENPNLIVEPKTWFVNVDEPLNPGEKYFEHYSNEQPLSLTSQHTFVYRKGNNVFIRFRTYLSEQEITVRLIKDYWSKGANKAKWSLWEIKNVKP